MRRGTALGRMAGLCLLAGVLVAGLLFPVVGGIGLASNQASDTVNSVSDELVQGEAPLSTTITDRDGVPIAYLFDQNRVDADCAAIPLTMRAAIIAIEDRRFYEHDGVDWRGTTRALVNNLTSSGSALEGQGGSTLTMQLVKNYRLYVEAQNEAEQIAAVEATPARKLSEIRIALQLERELDKDEILCRYLNLVFFGNNAYGVSAAAQTYFNTAPENLTIAQAALLAGMVRSTNDYDPVDEPEEAVKRRDTVINSMLEVGSIDRAQADAAKAEPLGIQQPLTGRPNGCVGAGPANGFYCQYVVDYLAGLGIPIEQLNRGGYTIRTNLDRRASDLAKTAANEQVPTNTPGIAATMAVIEPGRDRHRVRALVANRDYGLDGAAGQTSYALPSQVSPWGAGSIYKTCTAAAALDAGLGINTVIPAPVSYTSRVFKNGEEPYTLSNFGEGGTDTQMTLTDALARSPNTSFVALMDRLGSVDPVVDMCYRLGLRNSQGVPDAFRPGSTVGEAVRAEQRGAYTLGPTPTSPLELANMATTLVSGGTWCPPTPIDQMLDRSGQPVPLAEAPCEQAVPEGLANTLATGMSKDDQPGGTAAARAAQFNWNNRPMLGKTGTTQDSKSAGFIGATPNWAGAVLVFSDSPNPQAICVGPPPRLCGGGSNAIQGGRIPAATWFQAMTPLHEGLPYAPLPPTEPRYVDGGADNRVPNVVGRGENDARAELERAGFRVQVRSASGTGASRGTVVSQNPSGAAIRGDLVTLSVSDGSAPQPAPNPFPPGPPGQPGQPGQPGPGDQPGGPVITVPGIGPVPLSPG